MADDKKDYFFKSPVGILVIIILSLLVFMVISGIMSGSKPHRSHNNNWSNNNYFKHGQVPPSLAGYI